MICNKSIAYCVTGLLPMFFLLVSCSKNKGSNDIDQSLLIAYNSLIDPENDNYEVFVMNTDGSAVRNLSNSPGVDWVYYGFDDKLYFISDRDTCHRCYFLYEADLSADQIRKVADFRLRDSWLSSRNNGTELIVNPHPRVDTAFYIINTSGEILSKVKPALVYFNDPCFSPDGRQIVFRGSEYKFGKNTGYRDELFLMNADGTGLKQLTHYPDNDSTSDWHQYHAGPPTWEKNSSRITYMSYQKGSYNIYAIDPLSGTTTQLTPDGFHQGWHAWSPDGKWLTYDGSVASGPANYDIYLLEKDTGKTHRLTTDTTFEQAPVFARRNNLK